MSYKCDDCLNRFVDKATLEHHLILGYCPIPRRARDQSGAERGPEGNAPSHPPPTSSGSTDIEQAAREWLASHLGVAPVAVQDREIRAVAAFHLHMASKSPAPVRVLTPEQAYKCWGEAEYNWPNLPVPRPRWADYFLDLLRERSRLCSVLEPHSSSLGVPGSEQPVGLCTGSVAEDSDRATPAVPIPHANNNEPK